MHSDLLVLGAFPRCRCTAPGPAGAPFPRRRRRRLGTRTAGPAASLPSARAAPSSRVPQLFSSALSCCSGSRLYWIVRGLELGEVQNWEGSQVIVATSWPHLRSIILLRRIQGPWEEKTSAAQQRGEAAFVSK